MNAEVGADLKHIPRGPMPQGLLRASFQNTRMNSLGRNPQVEGSAGDILRWCLTLLQKVFPGHAFEYDTAYFGARIASG